MIRSTIHDIRLNLPWWIQMWITGARCYHCGNWRPWRLLTGELVVHSCDPPEAEFEMVCVKGPLGCA